MTVRSWTHEPIPMWEPKHKSWVRNAEKIAEDNKRLNAIPFAAIAPEGDVDLFLNQRIHHDLDKSGDRVRGLLTAAQAMEQGMAKGYTRGILAGNQAHDRYVAGTMWGGKDLTKYEDTILEFDPEVEQFLKKEAGSNKWNLMKPLSGEIPIFELMDETPEDMFSRPAPEGWKVEGEGGALDVLEKNDPDLYWAYKRELGGEEGLKKVTEGSRNPYEFFYNLSGSMQMNAMGKSLEVWERQISASEYGKEYAKSFVVSGILNDPDMLATMALSVGLSFFTFGTSLIGGAALMASKAGKYAKRIDRLSELMGHLSKWTRVGQRYLPENLGPTLIKSHLMKDSYAGMSRFGKYAANRLADTAEGLVTEPLAEVMNQRRQIAHGTLDEYNIGSIVHEGLIGAAISGPLHLNFLVGKTYQVGGFAAGTIALPFTVPATALSKKGMLKTVNDFIGKTLRYADPDYLLKVTKLTRASDEIKGILREGLGTSDVTSIESVTGDPLYDDMFNVLLNTLFEHGSLNEQQTMDALKGAAETIKLARPEDWGKMDPAQFAALLSKAIVEQHGLEFTSKDGTYQTTLDKVLAWQQNHFWISEKARKEGMSFTEYAKKLKEEGNYFDILPEILQRDVEERMGDTFETATHDEKYQAAIEVALELKQKKAEALQKPIDAIVEVNSKIDTIIREEGTGDPVGSVEGATNPLDYTNAANRKIDKSKKNINRRKETLEKEQAADTKEPTSPKAKYKWTKRREKRAKRIKRWEQAVNKLEELRRDLDTELKGWLEVNNVDSEIVELHNTVKNLKKNVDKSLEAVNKKGLTTIKDLTDLNFILGVELDVLFKEILTDAEKESVGTDWSLVRKMTKKRRINTKDLSPKALEALNKINEHLAEKSKLKSFIESILSGEKETLTAGDVNQRIFGAIQKIIKKKKEDLYASAEWEFHKEEIRKYEDELTGYKIKVAQIYKEQTSKEMRLFDAVYLQQNIAKWEKRQMRILEAKNDGLNNALDEWTAEGRSTIKLGEFINLLHELSPFRESMEENMSGLSQDEQQAILDKEYTRKEVKKIAAREFQKSKGLIGKFRPGFNERMKFPVRSSYIKRTYVDQVSDSEIFSVDFSPEYIVEHSNPGTSLESEVEAEIPAPEGLVVDEQGKPLVLFSGHQGKKGTNLKDVVWFTDDKEYSMYFAGGKEVGDTKYTGTIEERHVVLQNPIDLTKNPDKLQFPEGQEYSLSEILDLMNIPKDQQEQIIAKVEGSIFFKALGHLADNWKIPPWQWIGQFKNVFGSDLIPILQKNGYDGIIVHADTAMAAGQKEYIVFNAKKSTLTIAELQELMAAPKAVDTKTELYTTAELMDKKVPEIKKIAVDMKLATKLGITKTALQRKKKREIIDLIISNQAAPAMAKAGFTRDLQSDVKNWNQFLANLEHFAGTEAGDNRDGVAAFRIFSNMPEYFWEMGLGVHIIFRKAIVTRPGEAGIENMNDVALGSIVHTLRFDMDKVVEIARNFRDRGLAYLEGWQAEGLSKVLDSLEEELMKEGDMSSAHNVFRTLEFLKGLEGALLPFANEMFTLKGYILTTDKDTGFPKPEHFIKKNFDADGKELNRSEQDIQYTEAVREAIEKRLAWYVENNREGAVKDIADRFGIKADSKNWKEVAGTLGRIIVSRIGEIESGWTITGFGNGTIGWDAADTVGMALVDFLAGKGMPGTQHLTSMEHRNGRVDIIGNENNLTSGEPVQVALPVEGDLNMAMPVPVWKLGALVNNYKHRNRVAYFLNKKKFTEAELKALDEWRNNSTFIEDIDPTGEEFPVFIFPQFIGGHLQGTPMNRNDIKRIAFELMLDIPRISSSFIHDQIRVAKGVPIAFRSGTVEMTDGTKFESATYQNMLTHGDDFIVPFNRIGEIMAIEATSPKFEGLAPASIESQERYLGKFREAWEAANPGKQWSVAEALSTANDSDRQASGIYEMKLLSLAGDDTSRITVENKDGTTKEYTPQALIQDIADGVLDSQFSTKEKDDYYVRIGIKIIQGSIKNDVEGLGNIAKAFKIAQGLETLEQWNEAAKTMSEKDQKVLKALREMFKVMGMRRVYGGGRANFNLEFIQQIDGKGAQAVRKLEEASGLKISKSELNNLGHVVFTYGTVEHGKIMIDEALGMTGDVKAKALKYLSIEKKDQPLLEAWQDILDAQSLIEGRPKKELAKDVRELLSNVDTHRKLLDAKISQIAKYEGITREQVLKKRKYGERITEAKEYLQELKDRDIELKPGTPEWEVYTKILMPHDQLLATDLGYFRAVNIMNSSAYGLSLDKIAKYAKKLNFLNFDTKDFLGLEKYVYYHQMLPTATSARAYDLTSSGGMNPQGMSLERVAREGDIVVGGVTYKGFDDYMDRRKEAWGDEWSDKQFRDELQEFLTVDDAADRFGMQELTDDQFTGMSREEIEAELEQMLVRQEMITWASQDVPPPSVFPDYVAEDSDVRMLDSVLREWYAASEERHETLPQEMAREQEEWDKHGLSSELLKIKAKSGGLVNPEVAKASGGIFSYDPYNIAEQIELGTHSPERSLVVVDTSNPKGYRAMQPKYKKTPFHNKGILALQRKHVQEKIDEVMHPIDSITQQATEEGYGMVAWDGQRTHGVEVGWVAPWKRSSLPEPRNTMLNEFDVQGDQAGRDASITMSQIHNWAKERGVEDQLKQDHRAYPYFFVIMEMEKARNEMLLYGPRIRNKDEERAYRNRWLIKLHQISQLSRDIKGGSMKGRTLEGDMALAIANPPKEGMTWLEIMTSVVSEDNPYGIMVHPTLLHDALAFGAVPGENMITSLDIDGTSVLGDFDFNELQLEARAIQAQDFQKFLGSILYTEYIGKAMYDYEVDGEFIYRKNDLWKKPAAWELGVDFDHRIELINLAKQLVTENSQSLVLDVLIEEALFNEAGEVIQYKIIINQDQGTSERGKTIVTHVQRNALGDLGFGMLVGGNTKVKGKKATLGISPTAALNMFALLENARVFSRIGDAGRLNKAMGVKLSEDGRKIVAVPIQDAMKQALGFTARPIREAGIARSESLLRVAGDTMLKTVTDPNSHILGRAVTVVDLDHYTESRHEGGQHMASAWVESYIAPVAKYITELENSGFQFEVQEGISELSAIENISETIVLLSKHVNAARQGEETSLAIVMHISLLLENPGDVEMNSMVRRSFFDMEKFGSKTYNETFEIAHSLFRKLAVLTSEDKYQRDTPWHAEAKNFFFERKGGDDPVDGFKNHLQETGQWEAADEYIRARAKEEGRVLKDKRRPDKIKIAKDPRQLLFDLGLEQDPPDFNEGWLQGDDVISLDIETDLKGHMNTPSFRDDKSIHTIRIKYKNDPTKTRTIYSPDSTEVKALLKELEEQQNKGYKVITFNGNDFDWNIMGRISGDNRLASRVISRAIDLRQVHVDVTGSKRGTLDVVASKYKADIEKTEVGGWIVHLLMTKLNNPEVEVTVADLQDFTFPPLNRDGTVNIEFRQQIEEEINLMNTTDDISTLQDRLDAYVESDVEANIRIFDKMREGNVAKLKATMNNHNYYGESTRMLEDSLIETSDQGVEEPGDMEAERHGWAERAYYTAAGTEMSTAEVEAAMDFDPLSIDSARKLDKDLVKDSRTWDSMEKLAEKKDSGDLRRINHNIEAMVTRNFIDHRQARLIRALVLRAYRQNQSIIESLSFEMDTRVDGPAGAFKQGTKYFVRFGNELKELGTDKLSVVQIVAHELSHIGRLKYIADNGGDWMKFESIYHSDAGRSLLRKLIQSWHNGRWTAQAEAEYNNHIKNPEEFIAALGQYYLLKDILPAVKDLDEQEMTVLDKAKAIVSKVFDYVQRSFRNVSSVWVTFQREDPKLMSEVNTLIDRLFGWDPIAQRELEVKTQNRNQQLNWMNRFEERGPVEYSINDGQYEQMIEEHEALLESKELGTPMSIENTKRMNELAEMIQADDDEDYSMVAGSRRDYFRYKSSGFKRFGRKVGGKVQLDIEALLGAGGESSLSMDLNMESAAALHYLISQQAETFGNAISRGGGEFMNKVTAWMSSMGGLRESKSGNGVRNLAVNLLSGQTGAGYTWNAGHIIPIWMTSLLNDQIATVAGHYTNVHGTPSVQRVLEELAVHSQRVMADYRTIERILHPWMATLVGEGKVTEKQAERDMHDINTQVALKAEDATHEFEFTGSTKNALDSLDTDKRKKVLTAMSDISNTFREFLKRHTEDGIKLGVYGKDFRGVIPYKLSQVNNRPDEASSFNDEMSGLIQKRITEEGPDGRIDPVTMFGSRLIPTLHDSDSLVQDLRHIEKSHPKYFEWLLDFILITEDYELLGDGPELSLRRSQFMRNFDKPDTRDHFVRKTRLGIRQLYQDMARENITWVTFKKLKGDKMYSKYIEHANDPKGNSDRYDYLFARGLHHFIPSYIAYNPKHSQVSVANKSKIETPKDVHLHNLTNRARTGQYIPNDNWVIPKIQEAAKNETIRKHLILHPITLIEDFRKGIADEVGEKKMLSENYGIFGTYGDVISLFEKVIIAEPRKLKNYDGSLMSPDIKRELVKSAQVLREKHEYIRGIIRHKENPNKFESMLLEAAPNITKIAFGGNLMLATTLVESMMNVLQEGFGKGNLNAVMRGIFNPILALGENQREEVVNDLVHIVETLTRGYIPEYEKPAGHVEEAGVQKFLKGWGNQMMRPAQYMMKNIAITRAISVREFITKNIRNEKIGELVDLIKEQPLEDPDSLADRMRKVGISSKAHEMTISYLLRGGFLEPGKYLALVEMLPKEGRYSPFAMYDALSKEMSVSDNRYAARLEVIAGLKTLEKAYIEEVIVTPNAFDSYTGTSTIGTLWEIFTRYPVLFVAQHVFRKGSRLHPARYALGLISMMILDTIYMNLLKVAGGAKIEDVLKDWEENPKSNAMHYFTRLPVLGRYGGIIAQLIENAITGKFGQMPGGFVALGALQSIGKGGVNSAKGWWGNEDDKWQDTINFLRIVPMLGDSIIRMGIYAGLGNNINRRQYRSAYGGGGGGSRGSGGGSAAGHYGVAYKDMYNTYDSWLGDLVSELSPAEPLKWSDYEGNKQLKSMMPMAGQNRAQPVAPPTQAPAPPVQAPVAKDAVGSLLDQKTAEAPSGLLKGN